MTTESPPPQPSTAAPSAPETSVPPAIAALSADIVPAGIAVARAERALRDALVAAQLEGAETAARLFVMKATGLDRTGLIIAAARPLSRTEQTALLDMANRRLAREPLQRILGEAEFWSLPLRLSPGTLIPRPDTETLVEAALAAFPDIQAPLAIADLGTGSGAILAALLKERPRATGLGIDLSEDALETAGYNLARLGLAPRATLKQATFAEPFGSVCFDLVVSNPPYIESATIPGLEPEVALHDPRLALDGGPDGLDAYRAIFPVARRALRPGGRIMVEVGQGQSEMVAILAEDNGLTDIRSHTDLGGIERVVSARKSID
jgi:release factor glutamine methyltransferase